MAEPTSPGRKPADIVSFFERAGVVRGHIPSPEGDVPFGIEQVSHPALGIGGAYGAWGESYDNQALVTLAERHFGTPLRDDERLNLAPLGFSHRHHLTSLSEEEHRQVEIAVGTRLLQEALQANGWQAEEVDGILLGTSGPVVEDYTERIARGAGIPEQALKVSVHKACDSSVGALQLALNPDLEENTRSGRNIAQELFGKKILVGAIEGLSRFVSWSRDTSAFQLFGNGAGVIGVIPGKTMKFIVGKAYEVFDEKGVLAVRMFYPHSGRRVAGESLVEVSQVGDNHIRVAGLMHEPEDGMTVSMAGPMGMVKLFVRSGVEVVREVYEAYQVRLNELGQSGRDIAVAIVHHANYKINQLMEKHLQREGINLPMPWVLSDFGNVSAASPMIAFLRQLPEMKPGDHILFDGFGAGTYYDTLAVELGGAEGS